MRLLSARARPTLSWAQQADAWSRRQRLSFEALQATTDCAVAQVNVTPVGDLQPLFDARPVGLSEKAWREFLVIYLQAIIDRVRVA
jgi:hypothetical protein